MAEAPLPVEQYETHINHALGSHTGIDLRMLCKYKARGSGKQWINSHRPKINYEELYAAYKQQRPKKLDLKSKLDGRMWNALAESSRTFEKFKEMLTPHQDVDFYQSAVSPTAAETGHLFEEFDDVEQNCDPSSDVITDLTNSFFGQRNDTVISNLFADVDRKKLILDPTSDSFGKTVVATESWATNAPYNTYTTANAGFFSLKDDAPMLRALADGCLVPDKTKLIVLINPQDYGKMAVNNYKIAFNLDYVRNEHLAKGTLPEAFGLTFVKCLEVPIGEMYAWVKDAVVWTPWKELKVDLSKQSMLRYNYQLYIRESNNVVRIDDLGVFKIKIKEVEEVETDSSSSSGSDSGSDSSSSSESSGG